MGLKTKASKGLKNITEKTEELDIQKTTDSIKSFIPDDYLEGSVMTDIPEKNPKYKIKALDIYVIFSITSLLVFTVVSQWLAVVYDVELETLTNCFFLSFGGEILAACLIKIFKLKKHDNNIGGDSE